MYFLSNVGYALWVFGIWSLIGLGPLLILLPYSRRLNAFILAPLFGLSLLVLVGLFQITVLLVPLYARMNVVGLVFLSSAILILKWRSWIPLIKRIYPRLLWLSVIPLLLLIAFGILFHQTGYYLLVGGSDQLQYCMNAEHIAHVIHTGSILDSPVARQDHYLAEMCTRVLPYLISYRRGAEVILATNAQITAFNTIEAFPLTILCGLLTLGFALAYIARAAFRLTLASSLFLQFIFLSSCYFLLLHIQGSLALILSISGELVGIFFLLQATQKLTWRWIILATLILAGYLSIYTEPALINIVLPIFILIVWNFSQSAIKGLKTLALLLMIFGAVSLLAPYAIYSVYANAAGNIAVMKNTANVGFSLSNLLQPWVLAPVVLGFQSYYDNSNFNNNFASYVGQDPWLGTVIFAIFSLFAVLGFLKSKKQIGYLYLAIMLAWVGSSLIQLLHLDGLRFARSLHYAIPLGMLGLCLLVVGSLNIVTWIGKALICTFVILNIYTDIRVFKFLLAHNIDNDPILLRVQSNADQWQRLRKTLYFSTEHHTPVLISGFQETIRPVALANLLGSQTHVLGSSMDFWPIYGPQLKPWTSFNTRLSRIELRSEQDKENQEWGVITHELINKSAQAVVALGSGYPKEWKKDVFAPRIERFNNICDVVYRKGFAVELPKRMVSNLSMDKDGLFRWLRSSGYVIMNDRPQLAKTLVIEFEGKVKDLQLKAKRSIIMGEQAGEKRVKLSVKLDPNDLNQLMLIVSHPVKLRTMSWA